MAVNDAAALREWLRGCPELGEGRLFGIGYLGHAPGEVALCAIPGELSYRENILGEVVPDQRQHRDYWLALRAVCGGEAGEDSEGLGLLQRVAAWIRLQNAQGAFPEWEEGRVTAVLPQEGPAPADFGGDTARVQLRIRVGYRMDE